MNTITVYTDFRKIFLGGLQMEGQLVWKDEYNIGVDIIDREHKRLFKIINKLFRFTDEKDKSQ